jgi:hypothetical protein
MAKMMKKSNCPECGRFMTRGGTSEPRKFPWRYRLHLRTMQCLLPRQTGNKRGKTELKGLTMAKQMIWWRTNKIAGRKSIDFRFEELQVRQRQRESQHSTVTVIAVQSIR